MCIVLSRLQINPDTFAKRIGLLVCVSFIALLTSGIIYGFASLLLVFKNEGIYSHLCSEHQNTSNEQCNPQELKLNLIYTSAITANFVATPFLGFLLDWQGSRRFFSFGVLLFCAGTTFLAVANDRNLAFESYIPGAIFISMSGTTLFLSLVPFAELFPSKMSTIMSVLNIAFDSSTIVFYIFYLLNSNLEVSSSTSFAGFGIGMGTFLALFALIWPKGVGKNSTSLQDEESKEQASKEPPTTQPDGAAEHLVPLPETQQEGLDKPAEKPDGPDTQQIVPPRGVLEGRPLLKLLRTPEYLLFLLFHITSIMWITYYPSTVQQRLLSIAPEASKEVEKLVYILSIIMFAIFVTAPGVGFLIEKTGAITSFFIVSAAQTVWTLLLFIPSLWPHIVTFIIFALIRALYFSVAFVYIPKMFGYSNFGRVWGICTLVAAPFTMLQNPLLDLTLNQLGGSFKFLNSLQGITVVLAYSFPTFLHLNRRKYEPVKGL